MKKQTRGPVLVVIGLILLVVICSTFLFTRQARVSLSKQPTPTAQATQAGLQVAERPTIAPTPTPTPSPTPLPPTPTPKPTAPVVSDNPSWTLILSDDFNGTTLGSSWGTYNGPHGGGKSYYDPSEISVSNGMVHIQAERKTTNGLLYTTGGMAAFGLSQVYGKYEMRVKLPHGKGLDPYAILWPKSDQPNTAQVDLFESPPVDKTTLYCTNHGVDGTSGQVTANGQFADDFHILTYEWLPNKITFSVDGVLQGAITNRIPDFPMWLGLAISSGDAFTGDPDPTTVFPVTMDIDWVHIYKYNG
ncbi:glycoside hydrolase family 16 protein [Tengunoibacter tsumagoiensis]|uniref:GH16 domain-containing protein n=1 Tax=Tengunoibacter tsumagoiensis TaxID=2014871 RepID=A0A402AA60_9CHLR|nr:glycoside hydrolase family 16 protein [Tengunoibacter tsumagoiensis]GCE16009.1 hypothetical protein KTT_58680 [Tengunoibacter tsumagoiensis]